MLLISASSTGLTGPYPYPGDGVGSIEPPIEPPETPNSTDVPVEIWFKGLLIPADTLTLGMLTIGLTVAGFIIIPDDTSGFDG